MYCPACGTHSPDTLKFCRTWGMALSPISELVTDYLSLAAENALIARETGRKRRLTKLQRLGSIGGGIGLLLILLLLTTFFISLGLSKVFPISLSLFDIVAPIVLSIALPMIFIGTGLALLPTLVKELGGPGREGRVALPQANVTEELTEAPPTELRASVTEQTTRALQFSPPKNE